MTIGIALLRGINVGGKNKLAMADLRAHCIALGASEVETYIHSGNVVFEAPAKIVQTFPAALSARIQAEHALDIPVMLRSAKQMKDVVKHNPYPEESDPRLVHVGFLSGKPTAAAAAALDPDRSPPDRWTLRGRELYLHYPQGSARSKLTNVYFDRTLKVISTGRNWRTVLKLVEMCEG